VTDFDAHHALLLRGDIFPLFRVTAPRLLRDALDRGDLSEDAPVLVIERDAFTLVLLTRQLGYHHGAQGESVGMPWMASC
jgi:hypothetical protein